MTRISIFKTLSAIALICGVGAASTAYADGGFVRPMSNPLAAEECSACHMAFPAGFLPAASWKKIMSTLPDHFGEDASLGADAVAEIQGYLVSHASKRTRGIDLSNPPMRITQLSWFKHEHGSRLRARAEASANIGTMSNCTACHGGAANGRFDDD